MNLKNKSLKRVLLTGTFGVLTVLGLSAATANAQTGYYDPYYNQQNNGNYGQDRRNDNHHRKDEKREVKHHQRDERQEYGNSRELRRHQKEERRQVKNHQRNERRGNYNPYYDNRRRY